MRAGFLEVATWRLDPTEWALLLDLMDRLEVLLLDPRCAIAADASAAPADRFTRILHRLLAVVVGRHSLPILPFAEASGSGDTAWLRRMRAIFSPHLDVLRGLAEQAGAAPAHPMGPDPSDLSVLLVRLPAAVGIRARLGADRAAEQDAANRGVSFIVECATAHRRTTS